MESTNVTISFLEENSSEIQGTSGIKINNTWILTSGLLQTTRSNKDNDILDFIRDLKPGILMRFPTTGNVSNLRVSVTSRTSPKTLRTNEMSVEDFEIRETYGTISGAWRCPLLSDTLENIFLGWSFNDKSKEADRDLLTIFLLVRLHKNGEGEITLESADHALNHLLRMCQPFETPRRGVDVLIESTPFGNPAFIDSISRGIVSNVLGTHDCVMLTDTNAVPGCEGGPVYFMRPKRRLLCGMVVAPLSWCQGEWVDYTIVACLLPCLTRLLRKHEDIKNSVASYSDTNLTELLDKSVVIVRCGADWGSGIVLDRDTGTILTCSHVVSEAPERPIKVVLSGNDDRKSSAISGVWAKLVYRTLRGQAYDVAVLTVDPRVMGSTLRPLTIADGVAEKGEAVVSAGFPFFSTRPTITRGNISRVSPCMLQTTCCIQSGASGGPIIRPITGELLGMVVCNIITSRTLYPKLNMAVPMTAIKESITDYMKTGCVDALTVLTNQETAVVDAWNFHLPSKI